ncbi:MAG: 50S ribosomal protein L9 [Planctomycetes bacterium]|nr:50S ribosomal protein L9 [Planctomycetota bacterium]
MAKRNVELLLNKTVESLGLVGDVVKVKPGHARNYLLPHGLAEYPTAEKIEALKEARAKAAAEMQKRQEARAKLIERLAGVTIKLIRSVNDQGVLYGAVTHRDIADQLAIDKFDVEIRAVRLANTVRRIGTYTCAIVFDRELRTEINVEVLPDRTLELFQQSVDAERAVETEEPAEETQESEDAGEDEAADGEAKGKKGKKGKKSADKGDDEGDSKSAKAGKGEKSEKAEKADASEKHGKSDKGKKPKKDKD